MRSTWDMFRFQIILGGFLILKQLSWADKNIISDLSQPAKISHGYKASESSVLEVMDEQARLYQHSNHYQYHGILG